MISWDPRLWLRRRLPKPEGTVSLCFMKDGVAICHKAKTQDQSEKIVRAEFAPVPPSEQVGYIRGWVARYNLVNADCYLVLPPSEYELELIERPQVPDDELLEAVRWRSKGLLSTPVADAVINVLPLPEDAYRGRMDMLYVAAAESEHIKQRVRQVRQVGLDLQVIDIWHMALRNMALYLPEMESGNVALLELHENSGTISMFSHQDMYLTRSIELGFSSFVQTDDAFQLDDEVMLDRLALDLQRSLDYYESQLGKGVATRIHILPIEHDAIDIAASLQDRLGINIEPFEPQSLLPIDQRIEIPHHFLAYYLPVLGAVLRRSDAAS